MNHIDNQSDQSIHRSIEVNQTCKSKVVGSLRIEVESESDAKFMF
jgi:hypothetical protein